jgi:hypothetical protein
LPLFKDPNSPKLNKSLIAGMWTVFSGNHQGFCFIAAQTLVERQSSHIANRLEIFLSFIC